VAARACAPSSSPGGFTARVLIDWVAYRGDELVLLETTQGRPGVRGDN